MKVNDVDDDDDAEGFVRRCSSLVEINFVRCKFKIIATSKKRKKRKGKNPQKRKKRNLQKIDNGSKRWRALLRSRVRRND